MDFTYTLAVQLGISPFVVLDQDKDRVIMLINYYVEKADKTPETENKAKPAAKKQNSAPRRYDDFWNF